MADASAFPAIGDYGLIGDMHSCALVSREGSIDWCCFPRFDSPAVFARMLDERGGYFRLAPEGVRRVTRDYVARTAILETRFETDSGEAVLRDFMPVPAGAVPDRPWELTSEHQIVRILECTAGSVRFSLDFQARFDYGTIVPHAHLDTDHLGVSHGGPDALSLYCSAPMTEGDAGFSAEGELTAGERVEAVATYHVPGTLDRSHGANSERGEQLVAMSSADVAYRLAETKRFWEEWSGICSYRGRYQREVGRWARTLKLLTYAPSGALLAAATTSLPAPIGGERNWDYRFTWIRDASFAQYALAILGYQAEVREFKSWIEWSTLGRAADLQIMYGIDGERRLTEVALHELQGYRDSRPVRIGNGAAKQFQLDIYGELLDSAHIYRRLGGGMIDDDYWDYLQGVVQVVMERWREPDEGLWETRGKREHFVFSKVMCWVALDRAIRAARALDLEGDTVAWARVREEIRDDVLENGYDAELGAFTQSYGSKLLDAANLMLPLVRFLPATDERMRSTIRATQRDLVSEQGLVYRYRGYDDGLQGEEGAFVMCSFWLADNLIALGEIEPARELFEHVIGYSNDLGLLSEQIEPATGQLMGNFPQAFSHLGAINTAVQLERASRTD